MSHRLYTLGRLRLERDEVPVTGPVTQRRRLALLALLASAGKAGITREKAVGFLWPEQSSARARHLLSESLYVLRKELGEAISANQDELRLNAELVWSDVAAFRATNKDDVDSVLALYQGPFLDGFYVSDAEEFEKWVDAERADLAASFARAVEQAASAAELRGDSARAVELLRRLAQHDPLSNRTALRYMQALSAAGDRAAAIRFGEDFTAQLQAELGIDADAAVAAFIDGLRSPAQSGSPANLADFTILHSIGVGATAEVFLAREESLKRLIAVKVLRPEYATVPNMRTRFEREAQAAARIDHPNVLAAFRFGHLASGAPYIVMPYVNGSSLEDRLAATGPWSADQSRAQLTQIAAALAAAHKLNVVHRDVRPANVLYHRDSERPLLTDFGIAAILESGEAGTKLTMPGEQLGNVTYMSPEQLRGERITERADMYSLGVVAFEMLTGQLPFDARTPVDMMYAHANEPPKELSALSTDVDSALAKLVMRCLNKRPELRPYAAEFADATAR